MSFIRGGLSDEQRRRIEENRKKALERLQKKGLRQETITSRADPHIQVSSNHVSVPTPPVIVSDTPRIQLDRPPMQLSPEQKKRIEENRAKALELQKKALQNNRDATEHKIEPIPEAVQEKDTKRRKLEQPMTRKRDYIDYDFSTIKDTYGGFMDDTNDDFNEENPGLEEWKEKQKRDHIVRDLAPPIDITQAPRCFECNSLEIDPNLYDNFRHVRVCRRCAKEKPEKYALLTKTECKEDYLLTEPELQDPALLPRIEKPNPHGFSRMQLFLRFQVEEFAAKKWGGLENLDKEWEKREEMRLKRKDKKYQKKLTEMRRKARAEEFTRKLRNGKSLNDKHVHDWAAPVAIEKDDLTFMRKRCIDCGIEVDELQL